MYSVAQSWYIYAALRLADGMICWVQGMLLAVGAAAMPASTADLPPTGPGTAQAGNQEDAPHQKGTITRNAKIGSGVLHAFRATATLS